MQVPKVVVSQELIDEYAAKYPGVNHAHRPYCKLCSTTIDAVHNQPHRVAHDRWNPLPKIQVRYVFIETGSQAYKATFKNGQTAYYHISCLDAKPELRTRVEAQLRQETISIAVSP